VLCSSILSTITSRFVLHWWGLLWSFTYMDFNCTIQYFLP